ncbi:MAG TPA: response regulator [Myxococcaceae bacterium]|nr:response regulator [Myxococcaceae bacterium]
MGGRILVVDDEPSVLEIFRRVLCREGHRVHLCLSPAEALGEFTRADFDLVVVDKNMPALNGFDLLAVLRKVDPDLPAIMMTASPEPLLAPNAHLQGYLAKPFKSLKQISDTVRRVLELSELWRGRRRVA